MILFTLFKTYFKTYFQIIQDIGKQKVKSTLNFGVTSLNGAFYLVSSDAFFVVHNSQGKM